MLVPDERAALMDNPLRNGLLLCDLAGQLATLLHIYLHHYGDTHVLACIVVTRMHLHVFW